MTLKKLPIGIQSFDAIRQENYLYIDKTKLLHQLTDGLGRYFLSRPRRFGKSMLISTLQSLYEGRKELFEGLYIYDKWDWNKTYPVIRIDFAGGVLNSLEQLNERIKELLDDHQQRLSIQCQKQTIAGCFAELITKAHQKYGQKVVILIDEYDKPILDNVTNLEVAHQIREGLKDLYSVTKAQDEHIQFVLMTGVSKFSKVSLFSGVNQLKDITLHHRYATICGYTQRDLETSFAEHLAGVDWAKLKKWYNGYNFMGESVYNPFDVLLFIDNDQRYQNYWFANASPSFLLKLFKQQQYFIPELSNIEVGEEILNSFEIDRINPITLLFQTGYLTIDRVIEKRGHSAYILRVPNEEVNVALHRHIVAEYLPTDTVSSREKAIDQLYDDLCNGNLEGLQTQIKSLFAGVPWRNFTASELQSAKSEDYLPLYETEGYYASVLYAFFASMNAVIIPEDISNQGQTDMTIILGNHIYVMEFKLDKTKSYRKKKINPALKQIQDRQYSKKYVGQGKQVFEVGMIFNQTARNLVQMNWV